MARVTRCGAALVVTAVLALGFSTSPAAAVPPSGSGGEYYSLTPARVLDTRTAGQGPCVAAGETRFVQVGGLGGLPADASSVVLNVTAVTPTAAGFVTVFPVGVARPGTSSINFVAGQTVPNSVTVGLGTAGQVAVYNHAGCTHLVVDVVGFHSPGTSSSGNPVPGGFSPVTPTRRLDTRTSGSVRTCVASGTAVSATVAGVGGVPLDATSVAMNVTVVSPPGPGFVTAYPAGQARPLASTVNFVTGRTVANATLVKVGAGGKVDLYVFGACVDVVVDVSGFVTAGSSAGGFTGVVPTRFLDTRSSRPCVGQSPRELLVAGVGAVPADAASVTVNLTVVGPTAGGYLTAWPTGAARPTASTVNFEAAQVVSNGATVKVGSGGKVSLFVNAGCADVVVDVVGYTSASPDLTVVRTLAGEPTCHRNGTLSVATAFRPSAMAADSSGNLYFNDGQTQLRRLSAAGTVSTLAVAAPVGAAVDASGNVYFTEQYTVVRKVTPTGVVTTLAGTAGASGAVDGTGAAARFRFAQGVGLDPSGNVYVSDANTVRKVTAAGVVTTLAGTDGLTGTADGTGAAARFTQIRTMHADAVGNLYVVDGTVVRKVSPAGVVTTVAGTQGTSADVDGNRATATFATIYDLAVDGAGLVVTTAASTVRRVAADGTVTTLAGAPGVPGHVDGTGAAARFSSPTAVVRMSSGLLAVADGTGLTFRSVTPGGAVTTVSGGKCSGAPDVDGPASTAVLDYPSGLVVAPTGDVYFTEQNHTVRKISAGGYVSTVAGVNRVPAATDGTGTAARFNYPVGILIAGNGDLVVADEDNATLRRVASTGAVSTWVGAAGSFATVDGLGTAARLNSPYALAQDAVGNVYVAGEGDGTIRKVTPDGGVTTLAGSARVYALSDGSGPAARFSSRVRGLAVGGDGNVYVADTYNNVVRRVTPAGVVTTFAGQQNVYASTDGTGTAAAFDSPESIAAGPDGNLYVGERNGGIRKITLAGEVSTVLPDGTGAPADGTAAVAHIGLVYGLAFGADGTLYVGDADNGAVRVVSVLR